ncbi:MAG TPA: T9SS type A sorting domain-containing protein [Chryseolinea sp.]
MSKIIEYHPAPGQFTNTNAWGTPAKANSLIGGLNSGVSLGGYGGFVIVGFDHRIENHPDNPYGIDFTVFGNPLATGSLVTWSEAGIVMVMKDSNGNGLADDTWYELAGSDHYFKSSTRDYSITYVNPKQPVAANVPWNDNQGKSGAVLANSFHQQPYYPSASIFPGIDQGQYSFTGTRIHGYVDRSDPSYIQSYHRGFGYADNSLLASGAHTIPDNPYTTAIEGSGGDAFDIDWAIDEDGNHVSLDGIDFIKVYTAINADAGWLGEVSTEVRGMADVAPDATITGASRKVVLADLPLKLDAGSLVELEAYAFNKGIRDPSATIVYSVDNTSLAEIKDGKLLTKKSGKITVTASRQDDPTINDRITIQVISPGDITIEIDALTLRVNTRLEISARVTDQNGDEIPGVPVSWRAADQTVLDIVQDQQKFFVTGKSSGLSWLVVEAPGSASLKDSVRIEVLPEASTRNVYLTIKDGSQTILPRKRIAVRNFDLNPYVDDPQHNYGIEQIQEVTVAHAIAQLFSNEPFFSDLRFRDDAKGNGLLYLWRVPKMEGSIVSYDYGYGGTTAPNFDKAWMVKVNQRTYVNDLQNVKINEQDEVVVYLVNGIATPWEFIQVTTDEDTVDAETPITLTALRSEQAMDDARNIATLSSDAISNETVFVNDVAYSVSGTVLKTDELGQATLAFTALGSQRVAVAGEPAFVFVKTDIPVGIPEHESDSFSVWPNPVQDYLTIRCPQGYTGKRYQLLSIDGNTLLSGDFLSSLSDRSIDMRAFPPGLYILVTGSENQMSYHKILKR